MSALEIVTYPAPVLATPAEEVGEVTADVRAFFDRMVDTMFEEQGIGVAAPQVGEGIRAMVVDSDMENRGERILKLVDPEFVETAGEVVWPEGCLSIPGLVLDVKRHAEVTCVALDENGEEVEIRATGLLAVALQHEMDHLDGRVILDRVSALKRAYWKKKIQKHGYPIEMPGADDDEGEGGTTAADG